MEGLLGSLLGRSRVKLTGLPDNFSHGAVGHDNYHSVLSLMPEDREPGAKEPKRFTVNFFSTDGQYDKEKAAAKQPKKKMRPNPLDKARARAARS